VAFSWSPDTGRYRGADGRFVPDAKVREALDQVIQAQAARMRGITQSLIDGNLSLPEWQRESMQSIKLAHLEGLATANGGWAQLDQMAFGWVGQRIKQQYGYLSNFAQQIADGRQTLGPGALARAEMYAEAGRATHREAQRRVASDRGMDQERNRLSKAENCAGCIAQTQAGWVPVGTLVPCGSRDCLSRCKCTMTFRKAPAA
jgi:hypothetical protein